MSNWLKNIQGQLSEFANEVLNEADNVLSEAREEVADPDTELQVAKKKAAEAEKQLAIEAAKVKSLEDEKKSLEQQLYDAHVEMDTIDSKFSQMIKQRDEDIKKLKIQIEQINESGWNAAQNSSDDDQIQDLKKEIQHWKSLVDSNKDTVSKLEFERKIDEIRQKKEHEIQTLIESHADSIVELREMYEEKLQSLQVIQYNASSSTSNADVLDAVLLDKEELNSPEGSINNKKKSQQHDEMCRSKASTTEDGVVVEIRDDLSDEKMRQLEEELELCKVQKLKIIEENSQMMENLKEQNRELAQAYNDLNEEFETFKRDNAVVEVRNADLNNRIDSLKANLIEYEERYELAKRENMETVAQLEKLSGDFERLRSGIANVSQRRENCDSLVNEEVQKLRNALDESRAERERLRADVHRFQEAVSEIDVELEKLRESNHKLLQENVALTNTVATYDTTMKDIISSSEKDIGEFREQFKSIQESHRAECDRVLAEINSLRDENSSLTRQNEYMTEEAKLLREVNEKLKSKSETEDTKNELMERKVELLEDLRTQLSNDLDEKRAEIEELKKKYEQEGQGNNESEKEPSTTMKVDEDNVGKFANDTEMFEAQLNEALKANTEKSEECEELRNAARSLEREVEIRQNCVDEMITQTNSLQIQQQILTKENSEMTQELLTREREYLRLEQKMVDEQKKVEELSKKIEEFEETVKNLEMCIIGKNDLQSEEDGSTRESDTQAMKLYIEELKKNHEQQKEELELLRAQMSEKQEESTCVQRKLEAELREAEEVDRGLLDGIEKRVVVMEHDLAEKTRLLEESREIEKKLREELSTTSTALNEMEELKVALMQKHEESVEYYKQLEVCIARNQVLEQQVGELHKSADEMNERLRSDAEQHEKRGRELERLKEHLMIVEENSTREAVEAEHRETELRQRVRELEATGMAVQEGASETTQQLQINIAALTAKLESCERSEGEWRRKFDAELKAREQTAEALTSLQTVVHELSIDHERDTASASHRNLELQTEIKELNEEIARIRDDLDRQTIGKQASEEEVERMNLQLEAKQKIVEELENQIEELRTPSKSHQQQQDSYRVDDQTLRQLFLNYFMAEPSKRADIAMLLASILEYPSEEMEKFRNAVKQSFGQSSSFFGLTGNAPQQGGKSSLTEQFIRFLEVESESSKTAPHLPIRSGKNEAPLKITMDSSNQNPSSSSSSAALDSLLR